MNAEIIREYCLTKPETKEEFPFDEETLVIKVFEKIFILISLDAVPLQINLKCDPEKALELREEYDCVQPGYHMNKKHWNTISLDGSVRWNTLKEWIDHSYEMVVKKLPESKRKKLDL